MTVEEEFQIAQFNALRKEVSLLSERFVRIQFGGLLIVPILLGAGVHLDLSILVASGPVLVGVAMMVLLYLQGSIMRVGKFIRTSVEPRLANNQPRWEQYLESIPANRFAERLQAFATLAAFMAYFLLSSALGCHRLASVLEKLELPKTFVVSAQIVYALCCLVTFALSIPFATKHFKTNTTD